MLQLKKFFSHSPGAENEGGNIAANNTGNIETSNEETSGVKDENSEKKPLSEKIHDALQDWANDDQRDQEIDDRTP